MVLLDTNVISELMRPAPAPEVVAWFAAQEGAALVTAAVCQAEILAGIAVLPQGARREALLSAADWVFSEDFAGRVLPFDAAAAVAYADLYRLRRTAGRMAGTMDLMIAAIALVHGAAVASRDADGFALCGVAVLNPWAG